MSKYALLIGINYYGTSNQLSGCINDIIMIRKFLIEKKGYKPENITVLRDDASSFERPTRVNILKELNNLITIGNTKNPAELFFHYSGHGTWKRDTIGDETDGRTELICPVDLQMIEDNEIRILLSRLNNTTPLYCIMDCCYSGTNLDLPYLYSQSNGKLMLINDHSNVDRELLGKNIFQISGCRDNQTAADAFNVYKPFAGENSYFSILQNNKNGGALTWALVQVLNEKNDFLNALPKVHEILAKYKYPQLPQFSSSKDVLYKPPVQQPVIIKPPAQQITTPTKPTVQQQNIISKPPVIKPPTQIKPSKKKVGIKIIKKK